MTRLVLLALAAVLLAACATITYPDGRKAKVYPPMEYLPDGTIRPNKDAMDGLTTAVMQASPYLIDRAVEALQREDK